MGNLCGKQDKQTDNFSTPGRPLGSSTTDPSSGRAQVPSRATKPSAQSQGRPLGGGGAQEGLDARSAAARAAEERANAKPKAGALGKELEAQKRRTQTETLQQVSDENRRRQEIDDQGGLRTYD